MIKSKRMIRRNCSVLLPVLSAILLFTCGAGAQTAAKRPKFWSSTPRRPLIPFLISGSTCLDRAGPT